MEKKEKENGEIANREKGRKKSLNIERRRFKRTRSFHVVR